MDNNTNPGVKPASGRRSLPKNVKKAITERSLSKELVVQRRDLVELEEKQMRTQALMRVYQQHQQQLEHDGVAPDVAQEQAREQALAVTGESERFWNERKDYNERITKLRLLIERRERQTTMPIVMREFHAGHVVANPLGGRVWVILDKDETPETRQSLRAFGFARRRYMKRSWWQYFSDTGISAALTFTGLSPDALGPSYMPGASQATAFPPATPWTSTPPPAVPLLS